MLTQKQGTHTRTHREHPKTVHSRNVLIFHLCLLVNHTLSQPAALTGPAVERYRSFRDSRRHQLTSHIYHLRTQIHTQGHLNGSLLVVTGCHKSDSGKVTQKFNESGETDRRNRRDRLDRQTDNLRRYKWTFIKTHYWLTATDFECLTACHLSPSLLVSVFHSGSISITFVADLISSWQKWPEWPTNHEKKHPATSEVQSQLFKTQDNFQFEKIILQQLHYW